MVPRSIWPVERTTPFHLTDKGFASSMMWPLRFRVLQAEGVIRQAVVIDLDVHQGNGTAFIFAGDPNVFTFSMHGATNYPFAKHASDLDIALPNDTTDKYYLNRLTEALQKRIPLIDADIVFYIAGADPYQGDRYGKLKLTKAGLQHRDIVVCTRCKQLDLPVTLVLGGGYAKCVDDIVAIHAATVQCMVNLFG